MKDNRLAIVGAGGFAAEVVEAAEEFGWNVQGLYDDDINLLGAQVMGCLCVPKDRFVIDLEFSGNTVSSSIPLALANATSAGRLKVGMKILLAGFGVGYSWGGCILEW